MKQLIVNADGFGFTYGNNKGIFETLEKGFIRSVSVNMTWPAVAEVAQLVRDFPHVSVGVHLNLSVGPSILPAKEIPSLVGPNGEFHGTDFPRRARKRLLDGEQMRRELRAQIRRLLDLGTPITHWDGHQDRHLYPGFFEAAMGVAAEFGIPGTRTHDYYLVTPHSGRGRRLLKYYLRYPRRVVTHHIARRRTERLKTAGFCLPDQRLMPVTLGQGASYRPECWQTVFQTMPEGVSLAVMHPGYIDETLKRHSSWLNLREREREMLMGDDWLARARAHGIEPVSYHAIIGGRTIPGGKSADSDELPSMVQET